MATHDQLAATIRYLLTAPAQDHRVPLQDGSSCPHCGGSDIQKWGGFSGRQRYRCRACRRTFSTFTHTPLFQLKHPERWPRFLGCVEDRLSVRSAGELLDVDKDTALRWRHRLADHWRQEPKPRLRGWVVIGDFCLPHNDKGGRYLQRPPRHRGEPWGFPSSQTGPVTILVALQEPRGQKSRRQDSWTQGSETQGSRTQESGTQDAPAQDLPARRPPTMVLESVGVRRIRPSDYDERITPRVRDLVEIIGNRGLYCPLAGFARRLGVPYRFENRSLFPSKVFLVRQGLRVWLRPFRGVSTRRLDNYLEWFRRKGMIRSDQQSPPTERYRGPPRAAGPPPRAAPRAAPRSRAARSRWQPGGT